MPLASRLPPSNISAALTPLSPRATNLIQDQVSSQEGEAGSAVRPQTPAAGLCPTTSEMVRLPVLPTLCFKLVNKCFPLCSPAEKHSRAWRQ